MTFSFPSWFYMSPSPLTVLIYSVFTFYGYKQLRGKSKAKSLFLKLKVYVESLLVLGFWVLIGDILWCVACYLKFASRYSGGNQLIICIIRDIAGVLFCFISSIHLFKSKKVRPDFGVFVGFLFNFIFLAVWFMEAKTPALTDWTFAIKEGYPLNQIVQSLFISHGIGKGIMGFIYFCGWSFTK